NERLSESALLTEKYNLRHVPNRLARGSNVHSSYPSTLERAMYLGIDIGTSSVTSVIIDDDTFVEEQASAPLNVSRPQPSWSEQDPADWWTATNAAVKSLSANARRSVRAVGLSGQMHGATLLDENDKPLRPAILWNDGRSEKQCIALE